MSTTGGAKVKSPRLAIAAGNAEGVTAAEFVARAGGNAVDACLGSAIMAWVAEPFFASLAGSGFITVRTPEGVVEIVDGNNAMPLTTPTEPGQGLVRIYVPDYSDGMHTGVGAGSVGVPGILAAVRCAWERHGAIEWEALFQPAIEAARSGIPFPRTSAYYLSVTYREIWSLFDSSRAVFAPRDRPLIEGELLVQAELADALDRIAAEGPDVFYRGEVGRAIIDELARHDGFMNLEDLSAFSAEIRTPVATSVFGWKIESNPPPAVGGAVLTHMLALLEQADLSEPVARLSAIIEAQRGAMLYRRERYSDTGDIAGALEEALNTVRRGLESPSTTHSSSADENGYLCSLTESNGYGSGLVVSGILLNNTLGEEELNPLGVHTLPPGSRTHSNMAPTIATGPERVVSIGSPGANRIVSALAQTLVRLAVDEDSLADAVAAPRAYLDAREAGDTLCFEPGLPGRDLAYASRPYEEIHMFFGGVNAASVGGDGTVDAAHDPRRSGAHALV
jgi:gamma-glutamyltranspeptidase / glutathione hydrolase